jgi:hypothetical protein
MFSPASGMDKFAESHPSAPGKVPVRIGELAAVNLHACPYEPNKWFDLFNFLESHFPTTFFQTDKIAHLAKFR